MTEEQLNRIVTHLDKVNPDRRCPFCSAVDQFAIGEHMLAILVATEPILGKAPGLPVVRVTCRACSAVTMFDAVRLGVG